MRFCPLASGSRGNAIWVEAGDVSLLVDNGLSAKELRRRAALSGLDMGRLSAILVSHEHSDHLRGVGALARMMKIPVVMSRGTAAAAESMLGKVTLEMFKSGDRLDFGALKVRTLPISHDAAEPNAFVFESAEGALGLATDLGAVTRLLEDKLRGLAALILEFNHDFKMLMEGPYPWPLKQRVRGRTGHLPNDEAAALAARLHHADLKHLVLAHLSETNNRPEIALAAARAALGDKIAPACAAQDEPTPVFEF